jgi:hypothetical protein
MSLREKKVKTELSLAKERSLRKAILETWFNGCSSTKPGSKGCFSKIDGRERKCVDCKKELKRLVDAEKELEKVAWFCEACDEWHPKGKFCSVLEVRKVREERTRRFVEEHTQK